MGKGSGTNTCRPAMSVGLMDESETKPFVAIQNMVVTRFPQLTDFLYPSELEKSFRGGEDLYCHCPHCKANFMLKASRIDLQIKAGICPHCQQTSQFLRHTHPQLESSFSKHNDILFFEASFQTTTTSYLWECNQGHVHSATVKEFETEGCPGCNHKRWSERRLQAMMLGEILRKGSELNKKEWANMFLDWGLLGSEARGNQKMAMAHTLLKNFDNYTDYEQQIWFASQPYSDLKRQASKMNLRELGGQISFSKPFRETMWTEAKKRCKNPYCGFGYQNKDLAYADMHIDHIVPVSKGGAARSSNNLQVLCRGCNLNKSDKMPNLWLNEQKSRFKTSSKA